MPTLIESGPARMLELAKANGFLVPMQGYKVLVYGASPMHLVPQQWRTLRDFWIGYFSAAGAELVSYSAECDFQR
jgi:hypothetical protein